MRYQILRTRKLSSYGSLHASGQHTWRERSTPNADPLRTRDNRDLRPVSSAPALVAAVRSRVELAEYKAQKPVLCIEYLVTASPQAFARHAKGKGLADDSDYFRDALAYLESLHGQQNIVAANIQLDETTPHMVVYAVPLVDAAAKIRKRSVIVGTNPDGTKRREIRQYAEPGSIRLSAAHFLDGKAKLSKLQTNFHSAVARKYGLDRGLVGSQAKHARVKRFYALVAGDAPSVPKPALPQPGLLERKADYGTRVQAQTASAFTSIMEPLFARSRALDAATLQASLAERRRKDADRKRREAELRADQARAAEVNSRRIAESLGAERDALLQGLPEAEARHVLSIYRARKFTQDATQETTQEGRVKAPLPSPK